MAGDWSGLNVSWRTDNFKKTFKVSNPGRDSIDICLYSRSLI